MNTPATAAAAARRRSPALWIALALLLVLVFMPLACIALYLAPATMVGVERQQPASEAPLDPSGR